MATKLEGVGGGVNALVAGPLKNYIFLRLPFNYMAGQNAFRARVVKRAIGSL